MTVSQASEETGEGDVDWREVGVDVDGVRRRTGARWRERRSRTKRRRNAVAAVQRGRLLWEVQVHHQAELDAPVRAHRPRLVVRSQGEQNSRLAPCRTNFERRLLVVIIPRLTARDILPRAACIS